MYKTDTVKTIKHRHSSSAEHIDEPSQRKNLAHLKWKQILPKKIALNP